MQLDDGAPNHVNAAHLVFHTQWSYTTVPPNWVFMDAGKLFFVVNKNVHIVSGTNKYITQYRRADNKKTQQINK